MPVCYYRKLKAIAGPKFNLVWKSDKVAEMFHTASRRFGRREEVEEALYL